MYKPQAAEPGLAAHPVCLGMPLRGQFRKLHTEENTQPPSIPTYFLFGWRHLLLTWPLALLGDRRLDFEVLFGCWVKMLFEFYCFITDITSIGSRRFKVWHLLVGSACFPKNRPHLMKKVMFSFVRENSFGFV